MPHSTWMCPPLRPQNFHPGRLFKFLWLSRFLIICCVLNFLRTLIVLKCKNFYILKRYVEWTTEGWTPQWPMHFDHYWSFVQPLCLRIQQPHSILLTGTFLQIMWFRSVDPGAWILMWPKLHSHKECVRPFHMPFGTYITEDCLQPQFKLMLF
jgi:hypothetical protein